MLGEPAAGARVRQRGASSRTHAGVAAGQSCRCTELCLAFRAAGTALPPGGLLHALSPWPPPHPLCFQSRGRGRGLLWNCAGPEWVIGGGPLLRHGHSVSVGGSGGVRRASSSQVVVGGTD